MKEERTLEREEVREREKEGSGRGEWAGKTIYVPFKVAPMQPPSFRLHLLACLLLTSNMFNL